MFTKFSSFCDEITETIDYVNYTFNHLITWRPLQYAGLWAFCLFGDPNDGNLITAVSRCPDEQKTVLHATGVLPVVVRLFRFVDIRCYASSFSTVWDCIRRAVRFSSRMVASMFPSCSILTRLWTGMNSSIYGIAATIPWVRG